jgi:hypothetical protein
LSDLHLIITESGGYGWTFESPQLPELIGGRDTSAEVIADIPGVIEWAKEPDDVFDRVFTHEQHLISDPDGRDFLIRFLFSGSDEDYNERHETAGRLNFAVLNGLVTDEEYGLHVPVATTGERLYICVVDSDTLGWIEDQLLEREGCCVLAQHLEDGAVVHLPYGRTGMLPNGIDTGALGLSRHSTFSEMREAVLRREVESLHRTYSAPDAVRGFEHGIDNPLITTT